MVPFVESNITQPNPTRTIPLYPIRRDTFREEKIREKAFYNWKIIKPIF